MKNLKKLTYDLKRIMSEKNINLKEWGIKAENAETWTIANKITGEERVIEK